MTIHTTVAAALAQTFIRTGQPVRVRVDGTSMRPLVDLGDYVWVERVAVAALRPGDVITLWQHDGLLTHRLLHIDRHGCVTKGDNCAGPDPPIAHELIIGRVAVVERQGIQIDLRRRRWWIVGGAVTWLGQAALFKQRWLRIGSILMRTVIHMLVLFMIRWEKHHVHT